MKTLFFSSFGCWTTPGSAQGLLSFLCLGVTPGKSQRIKYGAGINPVLAMYKEIVPNLLYYLSGTMNSDFLAWTLHTVRSHCPGKMKNFSAVFRFSFGAAQ